MSKKVNWGYDQIGTQQNSMRENDVLDLELTKVFQQIGCVFFNSICHCVI
jgi:hypothetical protein